jgi:hypothetical protein
MSTDINIKKRIDIQEEGVSITPDVSSINFTGAGVTASAVGQDVTVDITAAAGSILYYMNQTVAQAPYQEFSSTGTTAAEQAIPATVAGGATATIAAFQTPSGVPNTIVIPQGLWQFFLHFNAATGGQSWIIRPLVYKRDLGGTETLLFSIDPITVTNMSTVTTLYSTESVVPNTMLLTTDRIVVKINMENTTGVSQTVNFRTEGSQHYSVATTTLNQAVPTGAVTSVTGTAPVVSSGGTAPAISMAQANGTTDGYLDSADWTTFNNKVDDNIYTADGTLAGNRAVTMAGNTLNFSGGTVGLNTVPTQRLDVNGVTRHRGNVLMDPGTTLLWEDTTGVLPTSVNSKIRWTINSDSAEIYAFSPAVTTDDIDFVFKISDNATSVLDNYVFWIDDFTGEASDSYPLEMRGLDFIVNPLRRYATLPANQAAGATNFNVLKLGATNLTGTILHANVTTERVGVNTSSPSETLDVNGKTKTTTFQMTTTPTAGYVLTSDASGNGSWQANGNGTVTSAGITAGTGISLAGTNPITSSGSITVTNAAPDQTVVLNNGTGINVTGTYPNFTIDNTDLGSAVTLTSAGGTETLVNDGTGPALATKGVTAGTGISLSSTATDLTVTNTAPDQVVALTAGTGIGVTGTYPNFTVSNTGALSDVNIYNSDGTLSADRTVAMNNNQLTFSGGPSANGSQINLSAAANRAKALNFTVGSGLRWKQQVSGTEIGGDIGSQLAMLYYDDAGVAKGTAFSISRTDGAFRLNNAYSLPLSGGTTGQVLTSTTLGLTAFQSLPAEIQAAASNETTNLTTGTAKVTFRMPYAMTLTAVRASLSTAQTAGALLTVDINLNGVSVLGTKLTFDNTEKTTVTAATPATIVTSALTDDGEITVDIDAVGTAGARGLKITLIGTRA